MKRFAIKFAGCFLFALLIANVWEFLGPKFTFVALAGTFAWFALDQMMRNFDTERESTLAMRPKIKGQGG
mgnify:CR=1 FL=1